MTALDQYERLESDGLWREKTGAQRRDVLVSFGHATLVISDSADRPLTHWSLPAVTRLNEGERPALFAPAPDAEETLEIADDTMIDAIETVRRGLLNARSTSGRLRFAISASFAALVVGLAVFWFPNALREQTLAVVPQSKRAEMGAIILGHLQSTLGQRCTSPRGQEALAAMSNRLFGPSAQAQIVVLPDGLEEAVALPGNIIVLDKSRVESAKEPESVAGYALAAFLDAEEKDALGPIIDQAGLRPTLQLLTTGDLPPESLEAYAMSLTNSPQLIELRASILEGFQSQNVDIIPLFADLESRGRLVPNQTKEADNQPVISDSQWIALNGICDA